MHPQGPRKTFTWPESRDTCYVPAKNILCDITNPTTTNRQTYKITDEDYQKNFCNNLPQKECAYPPAPTVTYFLNDHCHSVAL